MGTRDFVSRSNWMDDNVRLQEGRMISDEESNKIFYASLRHNCTYEVGMSIGSRCSSRCDRPAVQFLKSQRFVNIDETIFDAFCEEHRFLNEMFTEQAAKTVKLIDAEEYSHARKANPRIYYNSGVDELGIMGLQEYIQKLEGAR